MHLSVRFSTEKELKQFQDLLYEKSGQGVSFTGLLEAMVSEVTIVTAVHNIKSNKGSKTAGVDRMKMDKYLQMPKEELFQLIQSNISNYKPKPAKRKYIEKANGKKRPLGIPTVLDRIIQECMRLILETEVDNKRTGDYLYNLLFGYEVNDKYIEKISAQFGLTFDRPYRVGVIVIDRKYGMNLEQDRKSTRLNSSH